MILKLDLFGLFCCILYLPSIYLMCELSQSKESIVYVRS